MPTLQFSKSIRRRGKQVENASSEMVRRMAKASLKSLVINTRADTGVARSNWRVGVGAPPRKTIEAYSPYPKGSKANGQGMSENNNASAAISRGNARIASVKGVSGVGLTTGIFIRNSVDYINDALLPGTLDIVGIEARSAISNFRIFRDR